jgi:hypothetical protein
MYYEEHAPPHFHAYHGEDSVVIEIETLRACRGRLSRRAMSLILEWSNEHREELMENWRLAEAHEPLVAIRPLE